MKSSVYIETSVVSAYDDPRDHPVSQAQRIKTRDWWEHQRPFFDLYTSQAVVAELQAPGQYAEDSPSPGDQPAVGAADPGDTDT